jgi:hypothetical protein
MKQPTAEAEKTAGLADEPDTTGELEGQFDVPPEQMAALLQEVITKAMTMLQATMVYSVSIRPGIASMSVKQALQCRDYEYRDIVEYFSRRASVLAGAVHVGDTEPPPPSTDPTTIGKAMIRGGQELIQAMQAVVAVVGTNPMKMRVCQYMSNVQSLIDDMWRALEPGSKPGYPPEVQSLLDKAGPEEAPEDATEAVAPEQIEAEGGEGAAPEAEEGEEVEEPEETEEPEEDEKSASVKLSGKWKKPPWPGKAKGVGKRYKELLTGSRAKEMDKARTYPGRSKPVYRMDEGAARAVEGMKVRGTQAATGGAALGGAYQVGKAKAKHEDRTKLSAAASEMRDRLREARVKGTERGITQARKNVVTDRERRGHRYGKALGGIAGAVGGAAAGKKLIGGKGPAGTIAGMAAGMLAGREAGGTVGRSADISRHLKKKSKGTTKKASIEGRFQLALQKLGQEPGETMETEAPMAPGSSGEGPGMPPQAVGLGAPDMSQGPAEPTAPSTQPTNFLEAELMGQQAQGAQEAAYYKQQAQEAQGQAAEMQQAIEGMQQQLQQLQMQADQAGQSVQQATQGAMAAQDDALKQTQIAANMRMGMQKLRAQMLEVASQDPAEVAAQELQGGMGAQPTDPTAMGPDAAGAGGMPVAPPAKASKEMEEAARAQNDAAEQTAQAEEATAGGGVAVAPPPEGTPAPGAEPAQVAPGDLAPDTGFKAAGVLEQAKKRLPWALAGAGMGAAYGKHQSVAGPQLQQRVRDMETQEQGGFMQAMRLAGARAQAAEADIAGKYPQAAMGMHALRGAAVGALAGPAIGRGIQNIAKNTKPV